MPRKPQTDFSIDLSPTTEPSDGERSPPASPVPQPNAKKPYNFSEARRQALERGRQKRAANLKRQREEREAQKAQLKAKKEQALASKIQQELEEEVQPDSQAVKEQVNRSAKRKVKRRQLLDRKGAHAVPLVWTERLHRALLELAEQLGPD